VADLQVALREEQVIVEEKKAATDELIVSIGREKAVVDEAVESSREDEDAASKLQVSAMTYRKHRNRLGVTRVTNGIILQLYAAHFLCRPWCQKCQC